MINQIYQASQIELTLLLFRKTPGKLKRNDDCHKFLEFDWQMNMGIIEPYNNGFLEIVPEGECSDYWLIAAIHIDGEVFFPSPRLYRSERVALATAGKIYDWIANHKQQISTGDYYCSPLNLCLWQQQKLS